MFLAEQFREAIAAAWQKALEDRECQNRFSGRALLFGGILFQACPENQTKHLHVGANSDTETYPFQQPDVGNLLRISVKVTH